MTPRRLAWLLAARGPDLAAWPAPDRAAALLLLRADTAARAVLADALAAEDALPLDDHASRAALRRMRAAVRRALAPTPPVLRGARLAALAACVAAGLWLGLSPAGTDAAPTLASSMDGAVSATVLAALDP